MKNLIFNLTTLTILFLNSDLASKTCDDEFYNTKFRDYNTLYINLKTVSLNENEALNVNNILLEKMKKIPNNHILKEDHEKNNNYKTSIKPDRTLTGKIKKKIIKKEKYAGDTGKDQYLIKMYESVFYELEIELKENSKGTVIFTYKKYFNENDLQIKTDDIYKGLEPFYAEPVKFCEKKEIVTPREYFVNVYMINGFPINDYREFLIYSIGAGGMFGVKGIGSNNFILSAYFETAHNTTDNPDINSALTIQAGSGAGYNLTFNGFNITPEFTLGYIYSFYNVKYSDMETTYGNLIFRSAVELNTVIFDEIFFIKPVISNIFEKGNTLHSIDLLLGFKIIL